MNDQFDSPRCRAVAAGELAKQKPPSLTRRRRSHPQPFARGFAFEPLENAAQSRALCSGNDGQPFALVIRSGLGADLGPRDGGQRL